MWRRVEEMPYEWCHLLQSPKIIQNVKRHMNVREATTGRPMEFDIWMPDIHLCFEFQVCSHSIISFIYHIVVLNLPLRTPTTTQQPITTQIRS